MSDIFEGIEGARCQVDDIIVHRRDQVQHDERLHAVLKRLAEANVTLNLAKCEFSVTKVKVLGYVVSVQRNDDVSTHTCPIRPKQRH